MPEASRDIGPQLSPIEKPTVLDAGSWAPVPNHLSITPEMHISIFSDRQWEEFVLEWATTLGYAQVMRSGGAYDHGVDIAGFVDESGFEGQWDCYQCKHYSKTLLPGDAYLEITKIIVGTMSGHFSWPRAYRFASPKGCGTTLAGQLHSSAQLRDGLLKALRKDRSPLHSLLNGHSLDSIMAFIKGADFSRFGTVELHELVEAHRLTRWHSVRFGVSLPDRPAAPMPEEQPAAAEQLYLAKLLAAYTERHGQEFTPQMASGHHTIGAHYLRQRIAFYSAEALRLFARDSVPEGTFDRLQGEILDGVVDVHERDHVDGLERLAAVTQAAHSLAITANGLLPVVEIRDRTGICHQLANDDKLSWCHASTQ